MSKRRRRSRGLRGSSIAASAARRCADMGLRPATKPFSRCMRYTAAQIKRARGR